MPAQAGIYFFAGGADLRVRPRLGFPFRAAQNDEGRIYF